MAPLYHYSKIFTLVTIYTFGIGYGISSTLFSWLPWGIVPGILTLIAIHLMKVRQPTNSQVEKIIGRDLHMQNGDNNNVLMRTVAHRGAGLDAPENSLIAFKQCAEKGCKFIEFDIMLTKDGIPIVFHDTTFERMANDARLVAECTYKEVEQIDLSTNHPFSDRFKNTRVPTLDSSVKQMLADGQNMFIDIKDNDSRMVNVILELFNKFPELFDRAIVTTFFPNLIYNIRKSNPNIVCSMAYRPYFFSHQSYSFLTGKGPRRSDKLYKHYFYSFLNMLHNWALPRITYYILGLSVVLLHKDAVSAEIVKEWRDRGVRVCVWTVNQPTEKQYVSKVLKCTYLTDTLTAEETTHNYDLGF